MHAPLILYVNYIMVILTFNVNIIYLMDINIILMIYVLLVFIVYKLNIWKILMAKLLIPYTSCLKTLYGLILNAC